MRFSVGYELTEPVRAAILEIPADAWVPALDQDGSERENGEVCEITDTVDLSAWPESSRLIVRRERPHPGAQLSFTDHDGYRFQAILTDQPDEDIAVLECRHRQHAHVEDRIRDDKDTGLSKFPFKAVCAQRGVAGDRDARARPARLDPSPRPRRRARQGRAQADPLPPVARRRSARVLRPPREAPPPEHMAVGGRARRRVPETQNARGPAPADSGRPADHHHQADLPATAAITAGRTPAAQHRDAPAETPTRRHHTGQRHPHHPQDRRTPLARSLSRAYCTFRVSGPCGNFGSG